MPDFLIHHLLFNAIAAIVVVLVLAQFLGRIVLGYALGDKALEFRLFRLFPVMKVPYEDIEEPQIKSRARMASSMRGIQMNNRVFARGIVIGKRTGHYTSVTFTPRNPETFLAALNERRRTAPPRE